ncbi:MAG: hypothetical protein AABX30_00450 [Nanoarchaeota archaeon]
MGKRGVLILVLIIFAIIFIGLVKSQLTIITYAVNKSFCSGGNLGSPSDCTSELTQVDGNRFTIGGISETKKAIINGTWNISLSSSYTLVDVTGIFVWGPDESATYVLKWYFWNSSSLSYMDIGCAGTIAIGPLGDIITTCNLTNIYRTIGSLQDIRLENRINATASKRVLINYFAINVTYNPDTTPPNLTIISPLNQTYNNATILVNISASDENLNSVWFYNGSANVTYPTPIYSTFSQGSNTLIAYANDTLGNINTTQVTFFVDDVSPTISMIHPEAKTYGVNSLSLNYTAYDVNLGKCWYNIDNGANTTLSTCQNTTLSNVTDGSHIIYLFANDSLGNIGSSSVSFSVLTNAPALNLLSPLNNSFLNYKNNIYLNYSVVSGIGVSSCQLWGDFENISNWQLNQTNSTITQENNFLILNLNDRFYNWGVVCNDTQNRASNVNYTFTVDTILPNLTIIEPAETQSSQTNIPLTFSVNDINLDSCWYNLTYNAGGVYIGYPGKEKIIINNCSSTTFDVANDYSYILNFYANDSAGNSVLKSSSFSVLTSGGGGGGSGGGGGGGSSTTIIKNETIYNKIEIEKLSSIIVGPGEEKKLSLNIKNAGNGFLNDCKLSGIGEFSSWVSSSGTKGLSAGEKIVFDFTLKVPKDINAESYDVGLAVICSEIQGNTYFAAETLEKKLKLELIKVERRGSDNVRVLYSIEELSGVEQNVDIEFLLFDFNNQKVAEVKDIKKIPPNSRLEFENLMPIDKSLSGELNLLINLNSEVYSTFVQENVLLGATGLAIFGNTGSSDILISILIITLFLIFAFYIIRRIFSHKKRINFESFFKKNL